jgi:bacillithiol biosynthesis cysteine-adding enzyme BshC
VEIDFQMYSIAKQDARQGGGRQNAVDAGAAERGGAVKSECMPFTAIPHNSKLFLDFLFDYGKAAPFFAHRPHPQAVVEYARTLEFPAERRARVADVLERQNRQWGSSEATLASIERLRRGAVACISGQQVGVLGGPLYSLLKAVSALQMAEELTAQGIDAVPLFWLATEDHDLAEIASVTLPGGCEMEKLTAATPNGSQAPVGRLPLEPRIAAVVERAAEVLGPGWVSDALRESYREGESYGSAFARLFTRLLAGSGLILVDPLDDELHAMAQPIFTAAAERAAELDESLLERGRELLRAGYHEQVRVTPESTLLFLLEGNRRTVLHRAGDGFLAGARRLARQQVLDQIAQHPEQFSANVLLRPVLQDYLFPTAVYFAGPSEITYFAQAAVVYEKLLGRVTPVLPRLSATLVSPAMSALLERYGLGFRDLFHGTDRVCELLAARALDAPLQAALEKASTALGGNLESVRAELEKLDPTLVEAAARSERKMQYQLAKIARKAGRAELRRNQALRADACRVLTELFPHKELQERVLPGVYFLARYGPELIGELKRAAASHCPGHQIVRL